MKRSWKTTAGGTAALLTIIGNAITLLADGNPNTNPDWNTICPEIAIALGLIFSRDYDVTSEDQGIVKPATTTITK